MYNKDQSIFFTNKPSRVVEIIGIRNDAIHEPIPGHQLVLWQNAVSYLYILDYQRVNISLGSILVTGLDTNGCPLGNSKFILLSDNLNICLWLSACQVEKIIKLAWSVSHNVIGAIDNVSISCGHILAFAGLLSLCTLCYHLILWMKNCPDTCIGHDWDYQRWLLW